MTCNTHVAPKDRQSASARSGSTNAADAAARWAATCFRVLPGALWRRQSACACFRKHCGVCRVLLSAPGSTQATATCFRGAGSVPPRACGSMLAAAECFRVLSDALRCWQSASECFWKHSGGGKVLPCVCARARSVCAKCAKWRRGAITSSSRYLNPKTETLNKP